MNDFVNENRLNENGKKYQLRLKCNNISYVENKFRYAMVSVRVTHNDVKG